MYVNNGSIPDNTVTGFVVGAGGALTEMPNSPFSTGGTTPLSGQGGSTRIAISPVANFMFVSNTDSNDVTAFVVDTITGNLSLVPGSPFPTAGFSAFGMSLAITPDGKFLFAANPSSNTITIFKVNSNGSLTPVTPLPFFSNGAVVNMRVSPDGRFLLICTGSLPLRVAALSISSEGMLSEAPGSSILVNDFPIQIEVNCAGDLLFALELPFSGTSKIDVIKIGANGALSRLPGAPFDTHIDLVFAFTISNDGRFLFLGGLFADQISVFNVAGDGTISPSLSPPLSVPSSSAYLVTNQPGTTLYAILDGNHVVAATIANDGTLTHVTGSPFPSFTPRFVPSIAAYPPKICEPLFDVCIQDDSSGSILKVNSTTGDYKFTNCSGVTLTGKGELIKKGNTITLQHRSSDRNVLAKIDNGVKKATASIQIFSQALYTITDRNMANNTCACQ
ncbi:MAG TPA: beta-propeller fold lactonase family protein [Blastocatellia bacterium]|nr:beta-propeller fold lactonase family protein [Blastocatellia bacterium]